MGWTAGPWGLKSFDSFCIFDELRRGCFSLHQPFSGTCTHTAFQFTLHLKREMLFRPPRPKARSFIPSEALTYQTHPPETRKSLFAMRRAFWHIKLVKSCTSHVKGEKLVLRGAGWWWWWIRPVRIFVINTYVVEVSKSLVRAMSHPVSNFSLFCPTAPHPRSPRLPFRFAVLNFDDRDDSIHQRFKFEKSQEELIPLIILTNTAVKKRKKKIITTVTFLSSDIPSGVWYALCCESTCPEPDIVYWNYNP